MTITNLYFLKWIQKYKESKILYHFLISCISIILFLTFWITIPILFFIWLGKIMSRKEVIKSIGNSILSLTKSVKITKIIMIIMYIVIAFFCIALIIPILIIPFIYVGYRIEKPKNSSLHKFKEKTILDDSKRSTDKNILCSGSFSE